MLCLSDGATMSVNVFGVVAANQMALEAMQVVFPACLLQRTTMRLWLSLRSLAWYS